MTLSIIHRPSATLLASTNTSLIARSASFNAERRGSSRRRRGIASYTKWTHCEGIEGYTGSSSRRLKERGGKGARV